MYAASHPRSFFSAKPLRSRRLCVRFSSRLSSNSLPHNSFADPHPLTPVLSVFSKKVGAEGSPHFITSPFPYFLFSKSFSCNTYKKQGCGVCFSFWKALRGHADENSHFVQVLSFHTLAPLLHAPKINSFVFNRFRTLCPKTCLVPRHALHSVPTQGLVWVQRSNARRSSSTGFEGRFPGIGWRSSRPARGARQPPIAPIRRSALC